MGGGTWTASSWDTYKATKVTGKSASAIYAPKAKSEFLAKDTSGNPVVRESRDSEEHPNSTPIILGLDVTGSMSSILTIMAEKLGLVMNEVYDRNPVTDPQILFAAIGDSVYDSTPLQVTQFESDNRIATQLTDVYFEKGGGGNGFESYPLVWHFAGNYTECDNYEKRGKKGFIFTFGDDGYPSSLTTKELKSIFGDYTESDVPVEDVLAKASRKYEIYHFCMEQGGSFSTRQVDQWRGLLGERAITVRDYEKIPEIIVSILESYAGKSTKDIVDSWDGSTGMVVQDVLNSLSVNQVTDDLVEFS